MLQDKNLLWYFILFQFLCLMGIGVWQVPAMSTKIDRELQAFNRRAYHVQHKYADGFGRHVDFLDYLEKVYEDDYNMYLKQEGEL